MLFLFAINNLLGCPLFTLFALLNESLLLTCIKTGMMICFYTRKSNILYIYVEKIKKDTLSATITSTTVLHVPIQYMHIF